MSVQELAYKAIKTELNSNNFCTESLQRLISHYEDISGVKYPQYWKYKEEDKDQVLYDIYCTAMSLIYLTDPCKIQAKKLELKNYKDKFQKITGLEFPDKCQLNTETVNAAHRIFSEDYYYSEFEHVLIEEPGKYYHNTIGRIVEINNGICKVNIYDGTFVNIKETNLNQTDFTNIQDHNSGSPPDIWKEYSPREDYKNIEWGYLKNRLWNSKC